MNSLKLNRISGIVLCSILLRKGFLAVYWLYCPVCHYSSINRICVIQYNGNRMREFSKLGNTASKQLGSLYFGNKCPLSFCLWYGYYPFIFLGVKLFQFIANDCQDWCLLLFPSFCFVLYQVFFFTVHCKPRMMLCYLIWLKKRSQMQKSNRKLQPYN